jgi:cobalt-precorrin 5A hydrolase
VKTAIIVVSRDGLKIGKRLLDLYPQASIYAPPRLLRGAVEFGHSPAIAGDEGGMVSVTTGAGKHPNSLTSERTTQENLLLFEGRAQENSLPLEGGGSGWGCIFNPLPGKFSSAVAAIFNQYKLLIFISATAVAVRAIAPCLQGKDKDPAVVVIDDQSRFAISLLSGHLGGANEFTAEIAGYLGSQAVITTATDGRGITAFDSLARKLGWHIENLPALKQISAALLEEREIIVFSRQPLSLMLEGNIYFTDSIEDLARAKHGVVIVDNRLESPPVPTGVPMITLHPRNVAAGIGCRRGIPAEAVIIAVENAFTEAGIALQSLSCLASGEFKADEPGLIEAANHFAVPLKIFTREEIIPAVGDSSTSVFVEEQVGVGAVAEPCARLGSQGGKIVFPVKRNNGITIALAEAEIITKLV